MTTVRTTENIVDRVSKLFAKAEDPATPEAEAEEATRLATKLLRRYEIDEALVAEHQGRQTDEIIDKVIGGTHSENGSSVKKTYLNAVAALTCNVARATGLKVVYYTPWTASVRVVGWKSEVEHAEFLLASLLIQQFEAKKRFTKAYKAETGEYATAKEHKDFIEGFGSGVSSKIAEARREAAKEAQEAETAKAKAEGREVIDDSVALVLVSREEQQKRYYDEVRSKVSVGKGRSRYSSVGAGWGAGHTAGRSANIGGKSLGSQRSIAR